IGAPSMDERTNKAKLAEQMLTRPGGATMREIIAATGGPQYNKLKQLEGLGYAVSKAKEGRETHISHGRRQRRPARRR
ncbi:MAG: hypothetical protein P8Y53_20865, partial [Pseudolabrys sp.]